jgi:hypothetical protein
MPALRSSDLVHALNRIEQLVAEQQPELLLAFTVASRVTRQLAKAKQQQVINKAADQLRDYFLQEAAALLEEEFTRPKAEKLSELIRHYKREGWAEQVKTTRMPPGVRGTIEGYLWMTFKYGTRVPSGWRQIYTILKKRRCNILGLTIAQDGRLR